MQKENIFDGKSLQQIKSLSKKVIHKIESIKQFQYSELLQQKVDQFLSDFNSKSSQSVLQHQKQPYKLSLRFKSDPKSQQGNNQSSSETKSLKTGLAPPNIFLYTFELPCLYGRYENMIKCQQIQKKVDDIISEYNILKEFEANDSVNVQLVYLSYKRVMIIAPREFIYIRIFLKDQKEGQCNIFWIITFSVPYEVKSDKTRADIIFTAQKIEENINQCKINVKVYSQIDMKMGAKAQLAKNKGFSQIKKYIQKLYKQIKPSS